MEKSLIFFKFINSTNSEIFDVRLELVFYKYFGDKGGKNLRSTDIELVDDFISYIPKEKKNDENNLHCRRVRTIKNIEEIMEKKSIWIYPIINCS